MLVNCQKLFDYQPLFGNGKTTRRDLQHWRRPAEEAGIQAARLCRIRRVPCRVLDCEECAQRLWDSPDSATPALEHIDEYGEELSVDSDYERWIEHDNEIDGEKDGHERTTAEQQAAERERL